MLAAIEAQVDLRQRLTVEHARWLFEHAEMADLARLASKVRARFHAPNEATYLVMAIINYTNVCVAKCDYCSFYRLPGAADTYLLGVDEVSARVERLRELGGTLVSFNGGFHPDCDIHHYARLFAQIHERFPDLEFFEMTVAEFMFATKIAKLSYEQGAQILKAAGTRWVTGGGAEVLDETFRKRHSPGKYKVWDYYKAQRAILEAGMASTATMVIGFGESLDERLNHLDSLRTFQDQNGGKLASFLCWIYKTYGNELGGEEIGTQEYLRWLAVSRLFLDNFVHVRTSVLTKNEGALEGLRYGANDFDLPTEDEVTQRAGAQISHAFMEVLQHAERLGFKVVHRHALPRTPCPERPYDPSGLSNEQVLAPRPPRVAPEIEGLVPIDRLRRSPAA